MEFFTHDGFANATSIGAGRAPGGLVEHHLSGTDLFCVAAVWIACLGTLHFASNRTVGRLAAKLGIKFSNSQLRGIESRVVCGVHCAISAGGAALLLKGRFVGGVNVFNLHPGASGAARGRPIASRRSREPRAERCAQASSRGQRRPSLRWRSASLCT